MREKPVIQPFSEKREDQVRLTKVGGSIVITFHGEPIFYFPNEQAFDEFKRLKADAIRRKVGVLA
ncbi:hypothetical protein ACQCU3_03835 [Bacillus altitudinis]|uniref:hypothetical protein n=1 Tax=Bacillus altitudinis TaxID=293387 RepID=UPI0011E95BB0|nr:hypothetical protein [Bacillus altitudinis]QRF83732.1 hypothetical protein JNE42_01050 [Bacillus altitudinis]TYS30630.1 hypothetical protein FZC69_01855 [Bacillus altitudinis]